MYCRENSGKDKIGVDAREMMGFQDSCDDMGVCNADYRQTTDKYTKRRWPGDIQQEKQMSEK